jgi:phosphoenolpyruvate phosphomutase
MRTTTQLRRLVTRPEIAFLMEAHDALVVRGHRAEAIDVPGARFVDNPDFASTGEAFSLSLAEGDLRPGTLVAFGDIVLKRHIIQALLEEAGDGITLAVDSALAGTADTDRILADRADTGRFSFDEVRLRAIGDAVAPAEDHGVWIGLMHLGREGAGWLAEAIRAARADGSLRTAALRDLLARVLAAGHPVRVVYGRGGWVNVNDVAGLVDASGL